MLCSPSRPLTENKSNIDSLSNEIRRLQALKKSEDLKRQRLLNRLDFLANGEKIDTDIFKISYRKSEVMVICDEKEVPPEFIEFDPKVNKTDLKRAIKDGKIEATDNFYIERKTTIGYK